APDVQSKAWSTAQQAIVTHDGGPRKAQGNRQGGTVVLSGHPQGRTFCVKGRVIFYHRREVAGSGPLRAGSLVHEPGRSERLRPARPDQRVHGDRSRPVVERRGQGKAKRRKAAAL